MSSFPEASSSYDSQVSVQSYPTLVSNPPPTTAQPAVVTTSLVQTTRLADGKKMINQYVMDAKVGSGQHGNVWRCYENKQRNSKVLAMKIVKRDNPKARRDRQYKMLRMRGGLGAAVVDGIRTAEQEIRKEIAIMKKCRHPHVVRLYEVIDDRKNEMVFMVMEYLGGGEIQYTSPSSPGTPILTVEQTRRIMRDAILGLEYLHHQGIIHRDIKPANLLWSTGHDRVKIADFGTAHFSYAQRLAAAKASNLPIIDDNEEDPLLLNDADLAKRAGSPAFLAPEIVWEFVEWPQAEKFYPTYTPLLPTTPEGSSPSEPVSADVVPVPAPPRPPVTKSIDIWALGVTLYCLLFGKTPFRPPGDEGDRITEWAGYYWVCNRDWRAEDKMGWDGVLTGGQKAREGQWNGWGWLMNGVTTTETHTEIREHREGGDSAAEEDQKGKPEGSKEGALVMHLLDHFLQKDLERRITLEEVKVHSVSPTSLISHLTQFL
ncbi:kinase-like domain-containing protein [Lentinula edodes]|nr:kinase-like domain-containing protein [Lentinula edodes]